MSKFEKILSWRKKNPPQLHGRRQLTFEPLERRELLSVTTINFDESLQTIAGIGTTSEWIVQNVDASQPQSLESTSYTDTSAPILPAPLEDDANQSPTVAIAAAATSNPVTGTTTTLSVLGADDGSEANLTYTWSMTSGPAAVTYAVNGTNAAKNTVAKFTKASTYNFTVTITDQGGLSTSSSVSVPVNFGLLTDSVDIGSPTLAGSTSYNAPVDAFTVTAGGTDIGGTSDQFRYTHIGYNGNGQILARVTSVSNTNSAAKAGVMIRDSAASNAAYAYAWVSPSNQVTFETRSANGASASYSATVSAGSSPVWVKLVRSGTSENQFSAYYSLNGTTWIQVGATQTVTMAANALAGVAVTSHNAGALNTSVLDNVSFQRGRPTLNAERTTFVGDNGQLLRGPFTSTEWTSAVPFTEMQKLRLLGFNAVHLYAECFDINYPNTGSTAPGYAAAQVDKIVQMTRDLGLYVVMTIGNGANNGKYNRQYAEGFWTFYSQRYANETHVVFEIHNEPVAWGPPYSSPTATPTGAVDMEIAAYNIIRTHAPNTPVLLFSYAVFGGTGGGNAALQDIHAFNQAVFGNPNAVWTNEAVGFHGYAGAGDTPIAVQTLLNAGYPALMTEFGGGTWGTKEGGIDVQLTASLEKMNVSWLTFLYVPPWGVSDDITDPAHYQIPMNNSGLSWAPDYGNWPAIRSPYGNAGSPWNTTSTFVDNQLTGTLRLEAENYDTGISGVSFNDTTPGNQGGQYRLNSNVDIAATTDSGGSNAIVSTAAGEWLQYSIEVPQPGYYNLSFRYANTTAGAAIRVISKGAAITGQLTLPTTGGLDNWNTLTIQVFLDYGRQLLRIEIPAGGFNLNWIEFTPQPDGPVSDGMYLLVNRNSGQAMYFDTANNDVEQQPVSPSSNLQRWNLDGLGAGQYKVGSAYNGNTWTVWMRDTLGMSGWWGIGGASDFLLRPIGNGYYRIAPVGSGVDFEPQNGSTSAGASIIQSVYAGRASQQWAIIAPSDQIFPTGLIAFCDNLGKAQLNWTAASGASSYTIKRATTSSGPYATIVTGVTATGYVDTSVSAGTTYYYVVSAVNSAGKESINSVEASVKASSLPAPRTLIKFDESTGTTALDATSGGRNGTLQNGATWSTGTIGNAVSLDGVNDYVSFPTGVVNGLTNFTISTWVNLAANPNWARIFDFGTGTNNYMFLTPSCPWNSNMPRFAITNGSGEQTINSSVAISTNAWTHVAVTLSGNTATMYINGVAVGTNNNMTLKPSNLGATTQNYLGKSQYNDPTLSGKIDDFRIYSSALSSGAIAGLYYSRSIPSVATTPSASPSTVTGTTTNLSVLGADSTGESNLTYTWSTTDTPPAPVTFSANGTNAAKNTIATFSKAGTYNFLVSITNTSGRMVCSLVTVTVNQVSTGVSITPSSTPVTINTTKQFTAIAIDQFGVALSPQPTFTWSITSGGGSLSSSGLYTAPATAGSATIRATTGSYFDTASVTITTQTAPTIVNQASASPSPGGTTTALSVLASSPAGSAVLTYTWSLTDTPPAPVTFSANGTNAARNTTATFTKPGIYNFTVTIVDNLGLSTTSSVCVPVSAFGIFSDSSDIGSPALAGSLTYNASNGAYTVRAGGTDIWGGSDQFRYTYTSSSGNGQITCRVASVSNTDGWAKAGLMFRDSAAANAVFADVVATPGSGVSFQWRNSTGGDCGFAQVTGITAAVWLRLTRVNNQFSAYYSTNNVTWTQIGTTQTVNMATNALAGLAVTSHNPASLNTSVLDNVTLSFTPTISTAASATPLTVAGTTTNLAVLGSDDAGEANLNYTWLLTSGPTAVTFSANGTNAAKNTTATFTKAGSYVFLVTIKDAIGLAATSKVTVTVNQTLTTINVAPATVALPLNGTKQFSASALDQFGLVMSSQPSITWSVISGAGSINSTGLYTAPGSAGNATVRAASGSVIGTANVTYAPETYTWDGGSTVDSNWTTPENWAGDIAPLAGNNLVFPAGAARLDNVNDFSAGTVFGSINVSGSGYKITNGGNTTPASIQLQPDVQLEADKVVTGILTIGAGAKLTITPIGSGSLATGSGLEPIAASAATLPTTALTLPMTPPVGYDSGNLYPAGSINTVTYYSPSMGANNTMWVYLPPGYNPSQKYSVIYGYPGIGAGADTIFAGWCVAAGTLADNLIGQGKIKPVIIVAIDDNNGDVQSDTLNVIIPYIDSHYSTYADADHRGLYGYSWGGGYTFNIGCGNLNTFHYLAPSSAAPNKAGDSSLFPNGGAEAKQKLKTLLIACGTADYLGLYGPSEGAHNYCVANGIPHAWWPVLNGNHDAGSVWRPHMWNFLQMADIAGISDPPRTRLANAQIEAENFDQQVGGVIPETCSEGGQDVGSIQNGAYLVYNNVDFGSGTLSNFTARVASATSGGNIEIRLDSATGTLVGTCAVSGTGGWQTWVTRSCSVSGVTGKHNVYLKFTGSSGYLFNVNWCKFNFSTVPAAPAAPGGLVATAGVESAALSWTAVSNAASYNVKRATTSGGPYTTIANVSGTNYIDARLIGGATLIGGTTYYYRVSAVNMGGESANSGQVSVIPTLDVPSPWLTRDIGTVGLAGGASFTNGKFTVAGSGADLGGTTDEFRFAHVSATGDCTIIARVASLESHINSLSKAGVMIRGSLDANAANAFIAVTPGNSVAWQYRSNTGGSTTVNNTAGPSAPCWVKLVRTGNTFTGYYSANGTNWTQIGSTTLTMTSTVYIGLALNSHNDYTLCSATFDNVTAPGWAVQPASIPSVLVATPGVEQVSLSWAASSNAHSYNVKRATTSGGPYTTVATVTTTNYTDNRLAGGTSYYYVVSAVNNLAGESDNSTQVNATPTSSVPSPWTTQDIGDTGIWGSASQTNGVFTLAGSGGDIWYSADAFRYTYTNVSGNSQITCRVTSIGNTNSWAKAGLMFRDSNAANAIFADVVVTPGNGVNFQWRSSTGGECGYASVGGITAPVWLRLVRTGDQFSGYYSTNNVTWIQIGTTQTIIMATNALAGLAVTSHTNSSLCTAIFDNVSVPGWPVQPLAPNATAVSRTQVNVTWSAQTGATSYNVKRSTVSGGPYTTIATGITATSYTDNSVNLSSGTGYYYVVSAIVGGSETANGPEAALVFSKLTGDIIGTPGSWNNSGNTIAKVFDNNLTTFFDSPNGNGSWVGLDFGSGASKVITKINYCPRPGFESRMVGGIFQGANQADFSDAVNLATVGTQPAAGVFTSVNIANTAAFRYVRYLSPNDGFGNVAEVEFYGYLFSITTPPAPTGLIAGTVSTSQINITWNAVSNATSYIVKRATTSGGPYTNVATGVTGTGYANTGLSASTSYYYVVSAVNTADQSGNSTQVSATTQGPPTIATPASANPSTVTGNTSQLSVLGADEAGEANLKYTWSIVGTPPAPVTFSINGTNAAKNTTATFTKAGTYNFMVTVTDANQFSVTSSVSVAVKSTIAGRKIFYNNSKFDAASDANAIATDKQALLPGGTATFANYTSYSKGINGIFIDIQKLANAGALTAADFSFKVGNDNNPAAWATAPSPASVTVLAGAGTGGSDRVVITWADNAVDNQWLQITVKANTNTGLAAADVFYFGNALGESGNNSGNAVVDAQDESLALANKSGFSSAPITNAYDFNRDGRVTVADVLVARHNHTDTGGALVLISAPLSSAPLAASGGLQLLSLPAAVLASRDCHDFCVNKNGTVPFTVSTIETSDVQPETATAAFADSPIFVMFNQNADLQNVDRGLRVRNQRHTAGAGDIVAANMVLANKIRPTFNQSSLHDNVFAHSTGNFSAEETTPEDSESADMESLLKNRLSTNKTQKSIHGIIDAIFRED